MEVLSLNPTALVHARELLKSNGGKSFRLSLKKGGCSGFLYEMTLVSSPEEGDEKVSVHGIPFFLAKESVMWLLGVRISFEANDFRQGFVFENPNEISKCGCGQSVEFQAS